MSTATEPTTAAAPTLPAARWLRSYQRSWLRSDLVAGLAAGAVVVPQAMAYATIADLPVQVGLYTCMVPMLAYVLLGGSRALSMSTTSTVATLTASTLIGAGVASTADEPSAALVTLGILVGALMLIGRLLRFGGLIDNISGATLTGIKAGVGFNVAATQLPKVLGIPGDPTADRFTDQIRVIVDQFGQVSMVTVGFSLATIAVLLAVTRWFPQVPGPLVAVAAGIALVAWWSIDAHGIAVIAEVPSGLPGFVGPSLEGVDVLLPGAFAIALMCFMETASVGRSVRDRSEPQIDNDEELVANGVAAIAGAFFQAMPPAGGFSQTAINKGAGAKTQVSSLVTIGLAVASALFLGGVLSNLPQATLGCLVIVAVIGLIEPRAFVRYWRLDRVEFWVAVLTTAAGLFIGLIAAVVVGVVLTLYLVIRELGHLGVTEVQLSTAGTDVRLAGDDTEPVDGLLVLHVDGPMYTANVRSVTRDVLAAVDRAQPDTVLLDASAVAILPVTVLDAIDELGDELANVGVELWFSGLPPQTLRTAQMGDRWAEYEDGQRVFPTAIAAIRHRLGT